MSFWKVNQMLSSWASAKYRTISGGQGPYEMVCARDRAVQQKQPCGLQVRDAWEETQEVPSVREALLQDTGDEVLAADGRAKYDDAIVRRRKIAFPQGNRGAELAS